MKKIFKGILTAAFCCLGFSLLSCSLSTSSKITIDSQSRADAGGSGVLLQGFTWTSSKTSCWYDTIINNSSDIKDVFEYIWFPPVSDSGDGFGYHPRKLSDYNSKYGSKAKLESAIQAVSSDYTKPIADIVINHRVGTTDWGDFTNPSFGEDFYAICKDDEGFKNSIKMKNSSKRGAADTGGSWGGARDLDHTNQDVRNGIVTWMNELRTMGFAGYRYDYVRGYAGKYTGYYNAMTNPSFSVGEYWADSNFMIPYWISETKDGLVDGVKGQVSRAFDFELKGNFNSIFGKETGDTNKNYSKLASKSNLYKSYPGYAVTFVENHDTASTQNQYPMDVDDIASAYAFTLTHPGYPCVAWFHYFSASESKDSSSSQYIGDSIIPDANITYKMYIRALVEKQKNLGVNDLSEVTVLSSTSDQYVAVIRGENGEFLVGLGSRYSGSTSEYEAFISGKDFEIYYREY